MSLISRMSQLVCVSCAAVFLAAGCAQMGQKDLTPEYLATLTAQQRTTALLQQPQAGDIYAAQLDHFSQFDWGDDDPDWGQLRVMSVTPTSIVVVTAQRAWYDKEQALEELQDSVDDIDWDTEEQITIARSDLSKLNSDGFILEARRPASSGNQR